MPTPAAATPVVHVRAPDGSLGTVPRDQVRQAVDAGGEVLTPEQVAAERAAKDREEQYGGAAGAAAAAGLGAARGLTLGASDVAAEFLGGAKGVAAYRDANPTASTIGEIGGAIAPVVLSGGAAAPEEAAALGLGRAARAGAEVAGAMPRGVSALGGLAERGVSRLIGKGAGLGGRLADAVATTTAGAIAEGSLYGVGQALSDNALSDHPDLTAEKLLAGGLHGALIGGALGAVGGAAGEFVSSGARGLGRIAAGARDGEALGAALERQSGEMAWRSAGGTKAMARGADRFAGGSGEVGKIWRAEAPPLVGKRSFGELSRDELVTAAAAGKAKYGAELTAALEKVDAKAGASAAHPKVLHVVDDLEQIAAELEQRAGTGAAQAKIRSFVDDVAKIGKLRQEVADPVTGVVTSVVNPDARITFGQLRDLRRDADAIWAGNSVDPQLLGFKAEFRKARDVLEKRVEAGAATHGGEELGAAYEAAKKKYQAFAILDKAAGSGVAGEARNRILSLTDNIVGSGGAHVGGLIGSAFGPLGTAAGSAIGGAGGALANHMIRQRADFVGADVLHQVAGVAEAKRISAAVEGRLANGVRAFLSPASGASVEQHVGRAALAKRDETKAETFDRVSGVVADLASNPGKLRDRIGSITGPASRVSPTVGLATATKAATAIQYLASKMPAGYHDPQDIQQHKIKVRRPSDSDMHAAMRTLDAFMNPDHVLVDMSKGRVSREGVDVLKNVYPEMYSDIRARLQKQLIDPKTPKLTRQQKSQLSVLWDVPADASFSPDYMRDMQANFAADEAAGGGAEETKPAAPKRPIDVDTGAGRTGAQKVEAA